MVDSTSLKEDLCNILIRPIIYTIINLHLNIKVSLSLIKVNSEDFHSKHKRILAKSGESESHGVKSVAGGCRGSYDDLVECVDYPVGEAYKQGNHHGD